ncbi:ribonuclease HII [Emcibacter nanhaiensis]|uniref:Ribonuclease HII n=1 Tax=Emcibacter nanhaiensis TaxID=1505037 RepID=A0A501PHE6_9PROT|nr:ribonuclease HII [Emcibacter nanhaiensis]TPD59498.1 ribonuclease HII [Emcibacter nanhaiensis]
MSGNRQKDLFKPEPTGPDFSLELQAGGIVCGVDEVGRGPLAGPVVAAAVILDPDNIPDGLNDSKKLSARKRERLYEEITASCCFAFGEASVEEIDELNILRASLLAMQRAVLNLPRKPDHALVDGNQMPDLICPASCVIKGDARSFSIAAASIIAKVKRDFFMKKLAENYPEYGWERNAGYGTRQHMDALELVGASPFHRKSFAPIRDLMTQESDITY